jgi:peptide/nickel transport system substrate-binding protein
MMHRVLAPLMLLASLATPLAALGQTYRETPSLLQAVADGKLPPVDRRLPREPDVAKLYDFQKPGRHGGAWRMIVGGAADTRLAVVYGYARLVVYDARFQLQPDIAARVEVEDGRRFTFHLRPGHRWSDGKPFTSEDFRYVWDDVFGNPRLRPSGPPVEMLVDGEKPSFELLSETAVRYSWKKPNPYFLPALAGPRPLEIYAPAHYLRQFHEKYAVPAELEKKVREERLRGWQVLHNRRDNQYRLDNPELPTLQPWMLMTVPPADRFVFRRNPYYHRVDAEGRQLPYLDEMIMAVADSKIVALKTSAGESDLQARYLRFDNYTFLKEAEKRNGYHVQLWRTVRGADQALVPNLNVSDPAWRQVLRDARFRRALSLGTNRREINQVIYYGLGVEGNNTVLPEAPLYEADFRTRWARYDLRAANALLDEMGLTRRDSRGIRLLPDGRPMKIVVETAGESTEQIDILELVHDSWLDLGIKIYPKALQRDVLRNRVFAGETVMSIWFGTEFALIDADTNPRDYVVSEQQQLHWPKWGQYRETKGKAGEPVDMPEAKELQELENAWRATADRAERARIWKRILAIHAEQQFTIGLVAGARQPVVIANGLRNVPAEGVFNWEPGAHFGMYHPDTFYWASPEDVAQK